ncbi:site-specific integrase [Crossiella sp. SN42]|uniref:site-specific integrase n=1 Tax=Crossiella sp. SN42 TaxID=2944808 RepID=UPI00207C50B0|nr:site-specific integrase [Crossiella sp. SN42]MCO1577655.1 site-specific integrase [Crossiella sp. SN42]
MARPSLEPGTFGQIRVYKVGARRFRARTLYRDFDGATRDVERTAESKTAAEIKLKAALRDRRAVTAAGEITADSLVTELGEAYLAEMERAVEKGKRSPRTLDEYRSRYKRHIKPGMGLLRIRECGVPRLDKLVQAVEDKHGSAAAKITRTVLSGMFGLAVRHGALSANPVRDVGRIESETEPPRALTLVQAVDVRAKIHAHPKAQDWDLVDFTDLMLATGLRIGEASAITWEALNLEARTVEVRGTVIRVKGVGLIIKWKPKTRSGYRTLELPEWMVATLKRRKEHAMPNEWGVVFTSPLGGLRDPSNTQADLRVLFADAGYPWVTSHVYRKTVATMMDAAGISARQIADQLGHAKVSMTQDRYLGRGVAKTGAAGVLEPLGAPPIVASTEPMGWEN